MVDGDIGTVTFAYNGNSVTLTKYCYVLGAIGKPDTVFHSTGGDKPRGQDRKSPLIAFQISGRLSGVNAYADAKELFEDIFKPRKGTDHIDLTLTGLWASLYGSPLQVLGDGTPCYRILAVDGARKEIDVEIQVRVVK